MKRPGLLQQIVIGVLVSLCLTPTVALAQFGGPVTVVADTSPTTIAVAANTGKSFLEDLKHNIEQAKKWLDEQEHRFAEVKQWEAELTNLTGILGKAEEMVANTDRYRKTIADLGQAIRGVFQLYAQVDNMVRRRIIALKNIDDRLRGGIFNMDANLSDLEEYIRNGLGRASEDRINNLERLAQLDIELQRWYEELQACLYKKMVAQQQQKKDQEALDAELAKPEAVRSGDTIKSAKDELPLLVSYIEQLDKRISELTSLIEERCKKYGTKMKDMTDFARQVEANQQAWREFLNVNQEALRQLDDYQNTPSRRPSDGL